ncbi:hypothetical protein Ciccas_010744 [Cichlidogyrus casuarinus]|uniref:Uncharacterized protein n=1 Tax=Cichlidogyrus casuarinus TaxID=1844966 RepID=A0ABD2PTC8_9PLAT
MKFVCMLVLCMVALSNAMYDYIDGQKCIREGYECKTGYETTRCCNKKVCDAKSSLAVGRCAPCVSNGNRCYGPDDCCSRDCDRSILRCR